LHSALVQPYSPPTNPKHRATLHFSSSPGKQQNLRNRVQKCIGVHDTDIALQHINARGSHNLIRKGNFPPWSKKFVKIFDYGQIFSSFFLFALDNGRHTPHDASFFFISHVMPGKQQRRRLPEASMSHALAMRRARVSESFAVVIEKIQSRRAIGVMSVHDAFAVGDAASAVRRSMGTRVSISSPTLVISTVTVSSAAMPSACLAGRQASRMAFVIASA
jgi:hypothetical protein